MFKNHIYEGLEYSVALAEDPTQVQLQHLHAGSQPSAAPVIGDPIPSTELLRHQACM